MRLSRTLPAIAKRPATATVLATISLGFVAPAVASNYAVIAYSPSTGRGYAIRDLASRENADAKAMEVCAQAGATDCMEVVYTAKSKHCVALVRSELSTTLWASASEISAGAATRKALIRLATITPDRGQLVVRICNVF